MDHFADEEAFDRLTREAAMSAAVDVISSSSISLVGRRVSLVQQSGEVFNCILTQVAANNEVVAEISASIRLHLPKSTVQSAK